MAIPNRFIGCQFPSQNDLAVAIDADILLPEILQVLKVDLD
jgi:hypothetical protein